jgi:two-component system, OmpR family, phosphate regulon sensor histidine kinase PhoR
LTSLRLRIAAAYIALVAAMVVLGLVFHVERSLVIPIFVLAVMTACLGLFVEHSVLRPLADIAEAARAIASGDYSARVRGRHTDEVGQLAEAFNQMAATVQTQMASASQARSRLLAALNSSIDAVVALDRDGRVLLANLATESLFHQQAGGIVGKPFAWLLPSEPLLRAVRASSDRGERRINTIERPGQRFLQVVTTPILDGGDWATLVVFHDLTDVKRTEQVRRDFIANVSHELRTPLAGIKAVIETLQAGAIGDRAAADDFLQHADAEVDRLIELVEELLELSRIETGEIPLSLKSTDVTDLLDEVVERLRPQAERKRLRLTVDAGQEPEVALLDPARIERAVVNLVHNAIKFTPDGGSIDVSTARHDGKVVIRVHDTGHGIDAADLPRIFERFYKADQSRATSGSGIGLAIVKHTAEAHGGSVAVESQLGRGSTFSMALPVNGPTTE